MASERIEVLQCEVCGSVEDVGHETFACCDSYRIRTVSAALPLGSLTEAKLRLADAALESSDTRDRIGKANENWMRRGKHLNDDHWYALQAAKVLHKEACDRYGAAIAASRAISTKGETE